MSTRRRPVEPRLVSVEQAATRLGIGRTLLHQLIARGELTAITLRSTPGARGTLRLKLVDVDAYIDRLFAEQQAELLDLLEAGS